MQDEQQAIAIPSLLKEEYRVVPGLDVWYIPDYLTHLAEAQLWARLYPDGPPLPIGAPPTTNEGEPRDASRADTQLQSQLRPSSTDSSASSSSAIGATKCRDNWIQLANRRLQVFPRALVRGDVLIDGSLPSWLSPLAARLIAGGVFTDTAHGRPNHVLVNEYLPGQGIDPHTDGPAYASTVATLSLGASVVYELLRRPHASTAASASAGTATYVAGAAADVAAALGSEEYQNSNTVANAPTAPEAPQEGRVDDVVMRIVQAPRSLLVTKSCAYTDYLHRIPHTAVDGGLSGHSVLNWDALPDELRQEIGDNSGDLHRKLRVSLTLRDVLKVKRLFQLGKGR